MRCFQRERRGASIECVLQKPSFFLDHQSTKTNPIIYCLSNIKQLLENHIPTEVAVPLIKECPVVQTLSHRVIQHRTSISTTLLHIIYYILYILFIIYYIWYVIYYILYTIYYILYIIYYICKTVHEEGGQVKKLPCILNMVERSSTELLSQQQNYHPLFSNP